MADKKKLTSFGWKGVSSAKKNAFNTGTINLSKRGTTKKEKEEQRRKEEAERTQEVLKEFCDSFEDSGKGLQKAWVKGGVVNDKDGKDKPDAESKIYKPAAKLQEKKSSLFLPPPSTRQSISKPEPEQRSERPSRPSPYKPDPERPPRSSRGKPAKKDDKKKISNLEMFKEELKLIQREREERHRLKGKLNPSDVKIATFGDDDDLPDWAGPQSKIGDRFDYDIYDKDKESTNLYVGSINPSFSEQELCEVFGKYGPLASVKIMWPRSEEERQRGRNCGFVAFMNRKDGERALANLQGKEIGGFEMKLGWGKPVPIPPHPVYIPPSLMELTLPPPPSGLPFNAQGSEKKSERDRRAGRGVKYGNVPPPGADGDDAPSDHNHQSKEEIDQKLPQTTVKVVIPTDRTLLSLIHRMVEFVVREGPMFEAMIMNREINNPTFRFLFENESPAHVYYRWKLFSVLQGDGTHKWRTLEFRMFKAGSLWRPPPLNPYSSGMPDDLVAKEEEKEQLRKGQLTDSQRDRFEDILRDLTPERTKVGDAMMWALEHAEAAQEIVECIAESLSIQETPLPKKVSRLFLISDILYNCSAKVSNASYFRKYFFSELLQIFKNMNAAYSSIETRLRAEQFKQKVMLCFRAWEDWQVYPNDFLIKLQNTFLGLVPTSTSPSQDGGAPEAVDLDGMPLAEAVIPPDDLDGAPLADELDGHPLREESATDLLQPLEVMGEEDDLDGAPLEASPPNPPPPDNSGGGFFKSKWEEVDPNTIEDQAMTTSKWEALEPEEDGQPYDVDDDLDGAPLEDDEDSKPAEGLDDYSPRPPPGHAAHVQTSQDDEARRQRLREIELKVMKYQDDVEAGRRSKKKDLSLSQQLEHYRQKLLAKMSVELESERSRESPLPERKEEKKKKQRSPSPEDTPTRHKRSRRDESPIRSRSSKRRSRSPPSQRSRRRSASVSPPRKSHRRSRSRSRSPKSSSKHKHKKSKR